MGQNVLKEMATLSKLLQESMRDTHAFELAVARGYIVITDDGQHLRWTLGGTTLLAYFCGKQWCGDVCVYSKRKGALVWKQGKDKLPVAELNHIFGTKSIKQSRLNRKNATCPHFSQLIENLFDNRG